MIQAYHHRSMRLAERHLSALQKIHGPNVRIESRRNREGRYSSHGQTFVFHIPTKRKAASKPRAPRPIKARPELAGPSAVEFAGPSAAAPPLPKPTINTMQEYYEETDYDESETEFGVGIDTGEPE